MSSTITALTSGGGLAMAGDTSGQLELKTNNGTTAVTISTAQNVGIGVSSPSQILQINGGSATQMDWYVGATRTGTVYTDNSQMIIDAVTAVPMKFRTTDIERMQISSDGNLCVGTSSLGNYKLQVVGDFYNQYGILTKTTNNGTGGQPLTFVNSAGNQMGAVVVTGTTSVNYATSSDARLKENIVDAPSAIDKVKEIKVRSFDWIEDKNHIDYGFIAQELYDLVPEAVCKGDDAETITSPKATWQVDFGKLTPILLKAIQELNAKVDAQALEIQALKGVA